MAESDPLLVESYFDNGDYEAISSPGDPHCFIIGRTGSGKSASLRFLEQEYPHKVIRIVPENLSLPYITNLGVIRTLLNRGVRLEPYLRALWKHVMIVEILRHRYQITSPERKQTIISTLIDQFRRDQNKVKAIRYLEEFGDNFWCEADERIKKSLGTPLSPRSPQQEGWTQLSMVSGSRLPDRWRRSIHKRWSASLPRTTSVSSTRPKSRA